MQFFLGKIFESSRPTSTVSRLRKNSFLECPIEVSQCKLKGFHFAVLPPIRNVRKWIIFRVFMKYRHTVGLHSYLSQSLEYETEKISGFWEFLWYKNDL